MSLLSPDHLIIGLAPERLSALRVEGRWRARIGERYELALPAPRGGRWEATLDALEILLDQPGWAARDLTIILSSHYVHYAVLPASRGLAASEQNDLAHLVFRNLFGELSHDWALRVSLAGDQPTLASGVPHSLLKALNEVCAGRGRLRSIQPAWMAVFNSVRQQIEGDSGILALVEFGRISLAALENGQWRSIVSRAGPSSVLTQVLEDESLLYGRSPGRALWLCDLTGEAQLPSGAFWCPQNLMHLATPSKGATSLADWGFQ